jgi:hypothetical protein
MSYNTKGARSARPTVLGRNLTYTSQRIETLPVDSVLVYFTTLSHEISLEFEQKVWDYQIGNVAYMHRFIEARRLRFYYITRDRGVYMSYKPAPFDHQDTPRLNYCTLDQQLALLSLGIPSSSRS